MDELKFLQINLNKCEAAQAILIVEHSKYKRFVFLIQTTHFYGLKPSSIDERFTQVLYGAGAKKSRPRALIIASKYL